MVMDDGTCNKGEQIVEGRGRDDAETDTDTIVVNDREGDKEVKDSPAAACVYHFSTPNPNYVV